MILSFNRITRKNVRARYASVLRLGRILFSTEKQLIIAWCTAFHIETVPTRSPSSAPLSKLTLLSQHCHYHLFYWQYLHLFTKVISPSSACCQCRTQTGIPVDEVASQNSADDCTASDQQVNIGLDGIFLTMRTKLSTATTVTSKEWKNCVILHVAIYDAAPGNLY